MMLLCVVVSLIAVLGTGLLVVRALGLSRHPALCFLLGAGALVFAAAWVTMEFVNSRLSPYGSWGSVAYTQVDDLPLLQSAALTGLWGIAFLIAWSAAQAPSAAGYAPAQSRTTPTRVGPNANVSWLMPTTRPTSPLKCSRGHSTARINPGNVVRFPTPRPKSAQAA